MNQAQSMNTSDFPIRKDDLALQCFVNIVCFSLGFRD